jgi:hypothetical protein
METFQNQITVYCTVTTDLKLHTLFKLWLKNKNCTSNVQYITLLFIFIVSYKLHIVDQYCVIGGQTKKLVLRII